MCDWPHNIRTIVLAHARDKQHLRTRVTLRRQKYSMHNPIAPALYVLATVPPVMSKGLLEIGLLDQPEGTDAFLVFSSPGAISPRSGGTVATLDKGRGVRIIGEPKLVGFPSLPDWPQ